MGFITNDKWGGSSPRGRGTQTGLPCRGTGCRFIPAWAGNAARLTLDDCLAAVHPRVGGERWHRFKHRKPFNGSSPRGRGTRCQYAGSRRRSRFIPAWAGNARSNATSPAPISVHPRVGGERMKTQALSRRSARFIPAWAGNAYYYRKAANSVTVHPRVGGERAFTCSASLPTTGSSPRGRGTLRPLLKRP